jgi:hypothetical protein
MQITSAALLGGSPGATPGATLKLAFLRALRTFIQGVAGAFPAAGVGMSIVDASYWSTFEYSVLAAAIAAVASFLQNAASVLPADPTQKVPTAA